MAPNLKHFSLLSDSLAGVKVIKPKLAAPAVPIVDSASYWDFPADCCDEAAQENVLSTRNVEANLRSSIVSSGGTHASSDAYWNELEQDSDAYWNESRSQEHAADEYWTAPAPPKHYHAGTPKDAQAYWSEASANKLNSDDYWNHPSTDFACESSEPASYWDECDHSSSSDNDSASYWTQ